MLTPVPSRLYYYYYTVLLYYYFTLSDPSHIDPEHVCPACPPFLFCYCLTQSRKLPASQIRSRAFSIFKRRPKILLFLLTSKGQGIAALVPHGYLWTQTRPSMIFKKFLLSQQAWPQGADNCFSARRLHPTIYQQSPKKFENFSMSQKKDRIVRD